MSIIVWDGKSVACDMQINDGNLMVPAEKMWRLGDYVVGGTGLVNDIYKLKNWVLDGRKAKDFPAVSERTHFIVASPVKGLVRYSGSPFGIVHGFNACAFGSAREFAYGALALGQLIGRHVTAGEAALAACKYALHVGGDIVSFDVVKDLPPTKSSLRIIDGGKDDQR